MGGRVLSKTLNDVLMPPPMIDVQDSTEPRATMNCSLPFMA